MKKVMSMFDLSGRVALITGAGGHIGASISRSLAECGADLVLVDRDEGRLNTILSQLKKDFTVSVLSLCIDMESEESVRSVAPLVKQKFGRLDILINNAAFVGASNLSGWTSEFESQSAETWRRAFEVNLTSPFILVQSCLPMLNLHDMGSVINIGSIYGFLGPDLSLYKGTEMGNPAAYAASKGGLLQLTRWLSTVVAPKVRVNMISPGGVGRGQPKEFLERFVARTPLKRMATDHDFNGAVVFLASDMSAYITGQNIIVDGGWSVW